MRLVYDLFACQTGSRVRGIGRYNDSLVTAMARLRGEHRLIALADGTDAYQASAESLRQHFHSRLPAGDFTCYTYPPRAAFGADGDAFSTVATTLIHQAWRAVQADAILLHPFEGWHEAGIAPLPLPAERSSALQVALVYDFIPWLFPEQYLKDPAYKSWYLLRLEALSRCDLLLAISNATRDDAIRVLGIAPERVVNISGAVSAHFQPTLRLPPAEFGIRRPFVLYTGNVDYRKNLDGMLAAYALLPSAMRASHQLVLNQVGDPIAFRRKVAALGLREDEVITTGHISDSDLITLYSHCKLFVFASLYEGFGLPILEAMSCGAPVIAADNSSIPELVGCADMLFAAAHPRDIAAAMQHALSNDAFRADIAKYSRQRAQTFSWDRCAALAWHALEQATAHVKPMPRVRIALVVASSDPSNPTMRFCLSLLPLLAAHLDVDVYTNTRCDPVESTPNHHSVETLPTRRHEYATVLWHFDDDAEHAFMLPLMQLWPGAILTHAHSCKEAMQALDRTDAFQGAWSAELLHQYGVQGLLMAVTEPVPLALPHAGVTLHLNAAERSEPSLAAMRCWPALQRAIADDAQYATDRVADNLIKTAPAETTRSVLTTQVARHLAGNVAIANAPRLLVDVTQLAHTDAMTGIQRVVKQIARGLCAPDTCPRPVELVEMIDGQLRRARHVVASLFNLDLASIPAQQIAIHPGDTLLMIDSSWQQYGHFIPIFASLRRHGGYLVTVVYDLIPLQRPALFDPLLVDVFKSWIDLAIQHSDTLLCISRAVADDVTAFIETRDSVPPRPLSIRSWPLGADLPASIHSGSVRAAVLQLAMPAEAPLFLMVGTIEPRKNHAFVLDAMEMLWERGIAIRLVIAGQAGWQVDAVMQRISRHAQFGHQLFFIEEFTDAEINICYHAATALIAASVAEGFGLPIVEAALHGTPVLASDIPVFREVGGTGTSYFSLSAPVCLADAIERFLSLSQTDRGAMTSQIPTVNWVGSVAVLLQQIGICGAY